MVFGQRRSRPPRFGRERREPSPYSSASEDLAAATLGLVIVAALYSDGRAHVLGLPDSFFTPWHAFLYGGLLLLMAWLAVISRHAARQYWPGRLAVIPAGYGHAVIGAALFALGGVLDLIWHQIFGIEFGIDALLSPTHLLLFCGGALLLSGPLRAFNLQPGTGSALARIPPAMAVLGITGIAAFALSFLSGFLADSPGIALEHAPEGTRAHIVSEGLASAGLGSYVITSLVIVIPLTYMLRLRLAGSGNVMLLVTSVALGAAVLENFRDPPMVIAALFAAGGMELVLLGLRRVGASLRAQELALAVWLPLVVWSGQLMATEITSSVRWSAEMTTGAVALSALVSFATVFVLGHVPRALH